MATAAVRKFALSVDPDEVVDFAENRDFFVLALEALGFESTGPYSFRYNDDECLIKGELESSIDGFFLWMYVQSQDEHRFRLEEVAESLGGYVIDPSGTRRH